MNANIDPADAIINPAPDIAWAAPASAANASAPASASIWWNDHKWNKHHLDPADNSLWLWSPSDQSWAILWDA